MLDPEREWTDSTQKWSPIHRQPIGGQPSILAQRSNLSASFLMTMALSICSVTQGLLGQKSV